MVNDLRLVLAERAFEAIARESVAAGEAETGGILVGVRRGKEFVACFTVPAGPRAARTAVRFQPDTAWQQAGLDLLTDRFVGAMYLGDWHKHPAAFSRPSGQDLFTARHIVTTPEWNTPRGIFPIAVVTGRRFVLRAFALSRENLHFTEVAIDIVPDTDARMRAVLLSEHHSTEGQHPEPDTTTAHRGGGAAPRTFVHRLLRRLRPCPPC